MAFWNRKKDKAPEPQRGEGRNFKEFINAAAVEISGLISREEDWYHHLPYAGAMSMEEARNFEIEKRALWRRVIYDAQRTRLAGLKWETRGDAKVCPDCQKMDGRIFALEEYEGLNRMVMHIGCRCNLVSVRE
jgi:SPP1 gp7 family putative phage head morphogenesis protein